MTDFFFSLTPDRVLDAVERAGLQCTGRCMTLNSFENRVYDVEVEAEDGTRSRRVAKFYRPGRWSEEQILEEHQFLADLVAAEIPAIAPLGFPDGRTLQLTHGAPDEQIWFAIFPKVGGRAPEELTDEQLLRVGRLLARIHNVGATREAPNRVKICPQTYGVANLEFLLTGQWIPIEFASRFERVVRKICEVSEPLFSAASIHRLHGDCHFGNLLWNDQGPFFLDFDDMVTGPGVQDMWLLVPGRDEEALRQRALMVEGYEEMRSFDRRTLRLIEPLRALRFVHYAAWLARRWKDPAFPPAFPHFGSHRYWSDETDDLERQLSLIERAGDQSGWS